MTVPCLFSIHVAFVAITFDAAITTAKIINDAINEFSVIKVILIRVLE